MDDRQFKKGNSGKNHSYNKSKGQFNRNGAGPYIVGVPVPIPNSISVLPDPLWLRREDWEEVYSLERSVFVEKRVKPGIFSNWEEVKGILLPVHDRLLEETDNRIKELGGNQLIVKLYDQLEVMYGTLEKHRIEGMALTAILDNRKIPTALSREWIVRSPQLLGVRYLIESSIKNGGKGCKPINDDSLLKLIAFGTRIGVMDAFLDHVFHNIISHELHISRELIAEPRLSKSGIRSIKRWEKARRERTYEKTLVDLQGLQEIVDKPIKESQLTEDRVWKTLDAPMKSELGYSLTEWLHFNKALIEYFDHYERLKVVPKDKFIQYLRKATSLESDVISLLIKDRSLSRKNLAKFGRLDMLPSERFWRDIRLTNRPIVEIEEGMIPLVVFGVETVQQGMQRYFQLLTDTRLNLLGFKPKGPISRAFGTINEKAGNFFRDEIISACRKMGLQAEPEKARIGDIGIPKEIGPVDVFIYDKPHSRFILVEAKDVSGRITPRELRRQKEQFIGRGKGDTKCFLGKLYAQENWYRAQLSELRQEYGVSPDQEITVEGVIVVSHAMMWVFSQKDDIPVLDDYEFFRRVKDGKELVYRPNWRT